MIMMLELNKSRQIVAEFSVTHESEKRLVKTTIINTNANAVSTVSETLHDPDLYASHRRELRTDEQKLQQTRYEIEDEILEELNKEDSNKQTG